MRTFRMVSWSLQQLSRPLCCRMARRMSATYAHSSWRLGHLSGTSGCEWQWVGSATSGSMPRDIISSMRV